jgi:uncharacterized membrane protein
VWNWRTSLGFVAVVSVGLALLVPLPEQASSTGIAVPVPSPPPPATDSLRGMVAVEGKTVPLPEGEWRIAGKAVAATPRGVVSMALVRLHGVSVDAAVLIQTNRLGSDPSWGSASACNRTDLYFARIRYASDHDGSCAYAAQVDAAVKRDTTDPAWQQALLQGAGAGWRFPLHWIEAAYRITDPRDAIQVRYLFDAPKDADAASARSFVAWTEASWYAVGSGFRNRLDAESGLPDWRKPDALAKTLPPVGEGANEVEHLGTKMVTYRIFGTMTDMSVNYLWLGSLPSAGGLAVIGAVASSALYFFHELAWSHFEQPPALVGDLPGVGVEGPGPARS